MRTRTRRRRYGVALAYIYTPVPKRKYFAELSSCELTSTRKDTWKDDYKWLVPCTSALWSDLHYCSIGWRYYVALIVMISLYHVYTVLTIIICGSHRNHSYPHCKKWKRSWRRHYYDHLLYLGTGRRIWVVKTRWARDAVQSCWSQLFYAVYSQCICGRCGTVFLLRFSGKPDKSVGPCAVRPCTDLDCWGSIW